MKCVLAILILSTNTSEWNRNVCFDQLCSMVRHQLTKASIRQPISVEERLAVALRFLASGDSQQAIAFSFRIGKFTVSNIIPETCDAIWDCLAPSFLKPPTREDWFQIAAEFERVWNFPHCIGAIDWRQTHSYSGSQQGRFRCNQLSSNGKLIVLNVRCCALHCQGKSKSKNEPANRFLWRTQFKGARSNFYLKVARWWLRGFEFLFFSHADDWFSFLCEGPKGLVVDRFGGEGWPSQRLFQQNNMATISYWLSEILQSDYLRHSRTEFCFPQ